MTTVLRVGSLAEVLAYVPASLGFQPSESLVLVSLLVPRGRVGVVMRVDLTAAADAAADLARILARENAARAILITYSDDPTAAAAAAAAVRKAAEPLAIRSAVVTSNGYGWADEPGLSPMSDLDGTGVAAMSVYSGIAVRTSRDDLTPRVTDAAAIATARAAANDGPDVLEHGQALAAWRQAVEEQTSDPRTLGLLARSITDVHVRDAVLVLMVTRSDEKAEAALNGDDAAAAETVMTLMETPEQPGGRLDPWAETLARVAAHQGSEPVAAPAWTLWAITQWWAGAGTSANIGIEQALAADDSHRLAHLIEATLAAGIGPGWTRRP